MAVKVEEQEQVTREQWLVRAVEVLAPYFGDAGYEMPKVRVSCGFPGGRSPLKVIGQCWSDEVSGDKHYEVFISPVLAKAEEVISTLAHELVHAAVGTKAGHKGAFIACCRKVGLAKGDGSGTGSWKTAGLSDDWKARELHHVLHALPGDYPHAKMSLSGRKKQTTRMLKGVCTAEDCGAVFRMSNQWFEKAGDRLACPCCGEAAEARF